MEQASPDVIQFGRRKGFTYEALLRAKEERADHEKKVQRQKEPASVSTTGVVQYGRRKGSSQQVGISEVEKNEADIRQMLVLPNLEWQRLQDDANRDNHHNMSVLTAAQEREALHMRSKELVKHWPDRIPAQRQKKLEAKKIREAAEEEKWKQIDIEEAEYRAEKRKEAIEKAKTQQYYQTDRVKGLHSALWMAEVLKERDAQIELNRIKKNARKVMEEDTLAKITRINEQALQQERQKALQRKQDQLLTAEILKQQIKDHEKKKEEERQEVKRAGEEIDRLRELHLCEQSMKERKRQEENRSAMKAHQDYLTNKELKKATQAQRQKKEEEKRKQLIEHKDNVVRMRKEKQEEISRALERRKETVMQELVVQEQKRYRNEDEIVAKVKAEREAKWAREQREKEEKQAAMFKSMAEQRESMRKERERKAKEEKQKALEMLNATKKANEIFLKKQELQAQIAREERKKLQDIHIQEMAEKWARHRRTKKEEDDLDERNNADLFKEEIQFKKYAKQVVNTAGNAGKNTFPLFKATREGIGGGIIGGVRRTYLGSRLR